MTSFERAEKFQGIAAGIAAARQLICGIALGRQFGETTEQYFARAPKVAEMHNKATQYLVAHGAV